MESDMVNKKNSFSNTNNQLIKDFFNKFFPQFKLLDETSYDPYWGIEYSNSEVTIQVVGDIGFEIKILIEGKEYPLWQYDKSINQRTESNRDNILYQLKVLRSFLS